MTMRKDLAFRVAEKAARCCPTVAAGHGACSCCAADVTFTAGRRDCTLLAFQKHLIAAH